MPDTQAVETEIVAIIRTTFGRSDLAITRATVASEVDGWDSLTHANLIMAIEKQLGIRFDLGKIFDYECVGDLIDGAAELLAA